MRRRVFREHPREQCLPPRVRDPDPKLAFFIGADVPHHAFGLVLQIHHLQRLIAETFTRIGQLERRLPVKERAADFFLEPDDLSGQGLLRHMQPVRRPGNVFFFCDNEEVFEVLEIHCNVPLFHSDVSAGFDRELSLVGLQPFHKRPDRAVFRLVVPVHGVHDLRERVTAVRDRVVGRINAVDF